MGKKRNNEVLREEELSEEDIEGLSPDTVVPAVSNRIVQLERLLDKVTRSQVRLKRDAPVGRLRVDKSGKYVRYYHIQEKGDTHGVYIPKSGLSFARNLAQQEYNSKILGVIEKQLRILQRLSREYTPGQMDEPLENLNADKRPLILPVQLSCEDFAQRWLRKTYEHKSFAENALEYYTADGLRVRSKSEVIIADTLSRMGVPFKYECPCRIKGLGKIHPDFTCLNLRTRKNILWEHFGMMDSPDYSARAVARINNYGSSGYNLGLNLIATFETASDPLSAKTVVRMIELYLK
ncbi:MULTISPECIES: hypothetical protein [unclassified Fibrobacter]|uniref:hypothetical protein n=1 Tax=unclassified Fibrobacter TaxID=2634177 RepID=UPI000D6C5BDB|nr:MULTISPECIES: hypothetical protein [unclassified Fibrobacter]PWJ68299.1 hypothetical protein BGX12_10824 [Fibrobacter sp. UWR4]PZW65633.1 hypothetical protein C8E88_103024 [Fibrobacter sp. UWR1]